MRGVKTLPVLALLALLVGCGADPAPPAAQPLNAAQEREEIYLLAVEASSSEAHALGKTKLLLVGGTVCDFAADLPDIEIQRQVQQSMGVSRDAAFSIVYQAKGALCPEKKYS